MPERSENLESTGDEVDEGESMGEECHFCWVQWLLFASGGAVDVRMGKVDMMELAFWTKVVEFLPSQCLVDAVAAAAVIMYMEVSF